mmetsp:Transcript_4150/g.7029  ORF Transcript_4150/g.7029 Transcript_4150/m.7029 type:complete len:89 (+) Transcript_4150:452-718(+)
MLKIQGVLAIAENESEDINGQIEQFVQKFGELALKMLISDPALCFDFRWIGQKVQFNQHKQDSLDGFIKQGEDCLVILPPVYKYLPHN